MAENKLDVVVFQPRTVPGKVYVYYIPNNMIGRSSYPTVIYPEPEDTTEIAWRQKNKLSPDQLAKQDWRKLPQATLVQMQSIDEFNSFFPMEIPMLPKERREFLSGFDETYGVVAEHRSM